MRPPPFSAAFRRAIAAQPGLSQLPVCGACKRQVQPRDFGREHCKACEAERAEAAIYFQAQLDATLTNEPTPPASPMFDHDDGRPFPEED